MEECNLEIFNAGGDKNNSTKMGIAECLKKYFPKFNVSIKVNISAVR